MVRTVSRGRAGCGAVGDGLCRPALVAKVDADEYPEILQNFGIMGIPTLIYFKGGREVDRQVGMTNYNALKNKLERQLA